MRRAIIARITLARQLWRPALLAGAFFATPASATAVEPAADPFTL